MIKDVRREEMGKFAALSGCTYNYEISFVDIIETVTKLFKGNISVCCR